MQSNFSQGQIRELDGVEEGVVCAQKDVTGNQMQSKGSLVCNFWETAFYADICKWAC